MASCKPKALQTLAGRALIEHIIVKLADVAIDDVVIIHSPEAKKDFEKKIGSNKKITYVEQEQALGTAHALKTALPHVTSDNLLVLLGDVPLLSRRTITSLC